MFYHCFFFILGKKMKELPLVIWQLVFHFLSFCQRGVFKSIQYQQSTLSC